MGLEEFYHDIENIVDRVTGRGLDDLEPEDFKWVYDKYCKSEQNAKIVEEIRKLSEKDGLVATFYLKQLLEKKE